MYEYRIERHPIASKSQIYTMLLTLPAEGWELAGFTATAGNEEHFVWKRLRAEEPAPA